MRIKGDPVQQVWEYRQRILELYCPRLGIAATEAGDTDSVLMAGVVMAGTTTKRATDLFAPLRKHLCIRDHDPRFLLVGGEVLRADTIRAILPAAFNQPSPVMTDALARDLRSWLVEPDFGAVQREPLELDRDQREKVAAPTGSTGYRRLRQVAGARRPRRPARQRRMHEHSTDITALRLGAPQPSACGHTTNFVERLPKPSIAAHASRLRDTIAYGCAVAVTTSAVEKRGCTMGHSKKPGLLSRLFGTGGQHGARRDGEHHDDAYSPPRRDEHGDQRGFRGSGEHGDEHGSPRREERHGGGHH